MAEADDRVDEAARRLYAGPPEEFMSRRTELAKQARADGDAAAATRIEKLRKPTVGAWVVNAHALDDPSVAERLTDLGDRLRAAQDRLDAGRLRELTAERRSLVSELTKQALRRADRKQAPAGLRDEVAGTFDAAIADPEVAGRLGRLQRAEQWSGFGFLPTDAPQLTVVRGGRAAERGEKAGKADKAERAGTSGPAAKKAAAPKESAAERRRRQRELAQARSALEEAEAGFAEAQKSERDLSQKLKQLGRRLAKLQDELEQTRGALDTARKAVAAGRARRRDARTALDRAERANRD